jgi:N-acetylglucosaminyldiphosphoundecaprenol N-acetyl-beta-D-mannosaminyltransferase
LISGRAAPHLPIAALALALALALGFIVSWAGARLLGRALPKRLAFLLSGGVVYFAFALPLLFAAPRDWRLGAVLAVTAAAGAAGALSDLLRLPRWSQALLGLGVAALAVGLGILIDSFKLPFAGRLNLGAWARPLTMVWLLAVAYAVVLCRRLPGLVSGVAALMALTFLLVARLQAAAVPAVAAALAAGLAGASLGYLPHDFPPARLPLGAAGHWVLAFGLASLTVVGLLKHTAFLLIALPLLVLAVPVMETTYGIIYGSGEGGRAFTLGRRRELLHEALIRGGLSPRRCVLLFYGITGYLCFVALLLVALITASFLVKLALLAVFLFLGLLLFYSLARLASAAEAPADLAAVDLLGIPVARADMAGALRRIKEFVESRSPHMIVTPDASAVVRAQRDRELFEIFRSADLVAPDGAGVVWMAKILGRPLRERVPGVELVDAACELAASNGYSVYLLGGEPGVAEAAAARLKEKLPALEVAGCHHGYFSPEEEPEVVARIAAARPDILFVAFGVPKQEKWIRRHLPELSCPVAIGVGGSFDVISGRLRRAPPWMRRAGLEWLYRMLRQPSRLPRLLALARFAWLGLREALLRRR